MTEPVESSQVRTQAVSYIAASVLAFLIATIAVLALTFPATRFRRVATPAEFPNPSIRSDERAQRLELEAAQRERLAGKGGRVPIDKAMQAIVARGARAYDPVVNGGSP